MIDCLIICCHVLAVMAKKLGKDGDYLGGATNSILGSTNLWDGCLIILAIILSFQYYLVTNVIVINTWWCDYHKLIITSLLMMDSQLVTNSIGLILRDPVDNDRVGNPGFQRIFYSLRWAPLKKHQDLCTRKGFTTDDFPLSYKKGSAEDSSLRHAPLIPPRHMKSQLWIDTSALAAMQQSRIMSRRCLKLSTLGAELAGWSDSLLGGCKGGGIHG